MPWPPSCKRRTARSPLSRRRLNSLGQWQTESSSKHFRWRMTRVLRCERSTARWRISMNGRKASCLAAPAWRRGRENRASLPPPNEPPMKKIIRFTLATMAILGCALFGACATKSEPLSLYDLGPLRAASSGQTPTSGLPPLSIAEVNAPAWLDSPMMYFRLAYANDQQPRPYASSRWTMPPAQLFGQRLKSRLAQAGAVGLSAADGAANLALLRIE